VGGAPDPDEDPAGRADHERASEQPQVVDQPAHPQVVDRRAAPEHDRATELEVQEDAVEVVPDPRDEVLTRVAVGPQHAGHAVGDGGDDDEHDRCERETAKERHYDKASQT
jgi:hypothetical protein